jgi:plasmid stabilization system protein ParE
MNLVERNPSAASQTIRALYRLAESLDHFPERGFPHRTRSGREVRIVLFGHYRVVYRVDPGRTVSVIGVFHGAMNVSRYLP